MTRDDIIRMAREAGFDDFFTRDLALERFANLVAAAEREECAKVCDLNAEVCNNNSMLRDVLMGNAAAIRARGFDVPDA